MTSLQKQLQALQSKHNNELNLSKQRERHAKSLLFDPSVATEQTFEDIFILCSEGFEHLCSTDARFGPFAANLFGPQSKSFDRDLATADDNKSLDQSLDGFLLLLAGFLHLQEAQLTLEWLVRRFKIHEHNTESFVLALLPLHQSQLFVAALDLLPKALPTSLKFLGRYASALQNPPRLAFANALDRNPKFFALLNQYVLTLARSQYQYHELISFWAMIMVQAIEKQIEDARSGDLKREQRLQDEILQKLFPILEEALQRSNQSEFILGVYMLVVTLVSKANLGEDCLFALMRAICQSWSRDTFEAGISSIAVISCKTRSTRLPLIVLKAIERMPNINSSLKTLSLQHAGQALLYSITLSALQENGPFKACEVILRHGYLSPARRQKIQVVFDALPPATRAQERLQEAFDTHSQAELPAVPSSTILTDSGSIEPTYSHIQLSGSALQLPLTTIQSALRHFDKLHASGSQELFTRNLFDSSPATVPTFLIMACLSKISLIARCAAFDLLLHREELHSRAMKECAIWHALLALADRSRILRGAAALFLKRLCLQTTDDNGVSMFDLYGIDTPDHLETLLSFVTSSVLPTLDECCADAAQIYECFKVLSDKTTVTKTKKLSLSDRSMIFEVLSWHTTQTINVNLQTRMLTLLNQVDKVAGVPRSRYLMNILRRLLENGEANMSDTHIMAILNAFHPADDDALDNLVQLATSESHSNLAFDHIVRLWPSIHRSSQKRLLTAILNSATTGNNLAHISSALLKVIDIPTEVMVALLADLETSGEPSSKRQKLISSSKDHGSSVEGLVAKYSLLAEILESTQLRTDPALFKALLASLMETRRLGASSYINDTILKRLAAMARASGDQNTRECLSAVRTDILVDLICTSTSFSTAEPALELLSILATHFPQPVLRDCVPIFTAMSRHGSDFHLEVLDKTVHKVIPRLSQKLNQDGLDIISSTSEIISNFAAIFSHIPQYRRLPLFRSLVTSLNADESLFAIIAELTERHPMNDEVVQFSSDLVCQFGLKMVLGTFLRYADLLLDSITKATVVSQTTRETNIEVDRSAHMHTLCIMIDHSQHLIGDSQADEQTNSAYSQLLSRVVEVKDSTTASTGATRLFESVVKCAPTALLGDVAGYLLPYWSFGRALLRALEQRLLTLKRPSGKWCGVFLEHLSNALDSIPDESLRPQLLSCIDMALEKFGKPNRSAVFDTMRIIMKEQNIQSVDSLSRTLALHCVSSSIPILEADFIPLLPGTMDAASDSLDRAIGEKDARLLTAAMGAVMTIYDHLHWMTSEDFFVKVSRACIASGKSGDSQTAAFRSQLYMSAAARLGIEGLTRSISSTWEFAMESSPLVSTFHCHANVKMAMEQLTFLHNVVQKQRKSVISDHARQVLELILHLADDVHDLGESAEEEIVSVTIAFVLKLNDATLRPLMPLITDWLQANKQQFFKRAVFIFDTMLCISDKLKSIFTSYFSFVLNNAAEVLSTTIEGELVRNARRSVLQALVSFLKHDTDGEIFLLYKLRLGFWHAPSHFQLIAEPLVRQLAFSSALTDRNGAVSAITELGLAANTMEHLKSLNRFLLNNLKSDLPSTRLATVRTQQQLTQSLGDEWLSNLPEMLPYINEVQEDDDEAVEAQTHAWIKIIEDTLGQSLASMLQ